MNQERITPGGHTWPQSYSYLNYFNLYRPTETPTCLCLNVHKLYGDAQRRVEQIRLSTSRHTTNAQTPLLRFVVDLLRIRRTTFDLL